MSKSKEKNANQTKMKEPFLLVSLEEQKSKKLAEVISNDSCRKILDYLANRKDATETEISKDLKIPISTIHYNLKALQDANLVTVEEFHYSQKGKEVNHYSLANKFIIIAPKSTDSKFMDSLKKILPLTIITAVVAVIMQLYSWITTSGLYMSASMKSAAEYSVSGVDQMVGGAGNAAAPEAARMLSYAPEVSRPFMQSDAVAFFLIGAVSVIIIYFIYEMVRKK